MPDPKQDLPKKEVPPEGQNKKNTKPPDKSPPQAKPSPPAKKTPAQEKEDAFKYEMQYANGGFNNGVEVKPDRDGKLQLKISIYGGGEQKVMKIHPVPKSIEKLISAYEQTADQNDNSAPEITEELQKYCDSVRKALSAQLIEIVTDADNKIKEAIQRTFSKINSGF